MAALLAAIDGAECTLAKPLPQLVPLHGHGGPDGDGRKNEGESNKKLEKGGEESVGKNAKNAENNGWPESSDPVVCIALQARLAKNGFFFGHLFFNITNVFCAKKRVGHACICPRMVTS